MLLRWVLEPPQVMDYMVCLSPVGYGVLADVSSVNHSSEQSNPYNSAYSLTAEKQLFSKLVVQGLLLTVAEMGLQMMKYF